jgi:hypothetical protein
MTNATFSERLSAIFPTFAHLKPMAQAEVKYALLLYVFRGCSFSDLKKYLLIELGVVNREDITNFVATDGYLLKNIKGYLLHACTAQTPTACYRLSHTWGIEHEDIKLARLVAPNAPPTVMSSLGQTCSEVIRDTASRYAHNLLPTPLRLQQHIERIIGEMDTYLSSFIGKKFRFVMQSHALESDDIKIELQLKALSTYYLAYPCFEHTEHALKLCKSACKRRGINMLEYYSSQRRCDLTRTESGEYASLRVPLDTNQTANELVAPSALFHLPDTVTNQYRPDSSLELDYAKLDDLLAEHSDYRRLVRLLSGKRSDKFSAYLKLRNISTRDGEDFYEYCCNRGAFSMYARAAGGFCRIIGTRLLNFLAYLQQMFMSYYEDSARGASVGVSSTMKKVFGGLMSKYRWADIRPALVA